MEQKFDLGIVGLATMGRNLALNFLDHKQRITVWNLEPELTEAFKAEHQQDALYCASDLVDLVRSLARPRRILLMIQAGNPVDEVLGELTPLLDAGDIVIDGGNTQFLDTRRRHTALAEMGIEFVGMGVSGGESGARFGPSLMFGGSEPAWSQLQAQLTPIAAESSWGPCAARMGPDGAGHFVKMIHNGIEYGDMQLIAEVYDIFTRGLKYPAAESGSVFAAWNDGPLQSYLIELTSKVLAKKDDITGKPLVDMILDAAEQKGTGRWTVQAALDLGVPIPTIAAAVDARSISSRKQARVTAAQFLTGPPAVKPDIAVGTIERALLAAKLCTYTQGMQLIRAGSNHYDWQIPLAAAARVWTGGCIIRARLLNDIINALTETPDLDNLLIHPAIAEMINAAVPALRLLVSTAASAGIPTPAFSASLGWFDGIRSTRLPQNLTQSQRDAFGAHTYRRIDDPDGEAIHTEWLK